MAEPGSVFVDKAFLWTWVFTLALHMAGFIVAYLLQTEVFFDCLGALNYLLLIAYGVWQGGMVTSAPDSRKIIMTVLPACARIWLLSFLTYRAKKRRGDGRFDDIKPFFLMFFGLWFFSAVWVWTAALPCIFVLCTKARIPLNAGDWVVAVLYVLGFFIEVVSDLQKNNWIFNKNREGGFCEDGLWCYSRHPNYFGEILMQWCGWFLCITVFASSSGIDSELLGRGIGASAGPLFSTSVLLLGTGMPTCEGENLKRYYEDAEVRPRYVKYREETSVIWPMPKALWAVVPLVLKRTILCEWKRYEYDPHNKRTADKHAEAVRDADAQKQKPRSRSEGWSEPH